MEVHLRFVDEIDRVTWSRSRGLSIDFLTGEVDAFTHPAAGTGAKHLESHKGAMVESSADQAAGLLALPLVGRRDRDRNWAAFQDERGGQPVRELRDFC